MKIHKISRLYPAVFAALLLSLSRSGAAVPLFLSDTIDLSPGTDAYTARHVAINHTTHKLYVAGAAVINYGGFGVKVVDTTTNKVIAGIDLGKYTIGADHPAVPADVVAVDESATSGGNRAYAAGFGGFSNQTLRTVMRVIDGATDTRVSTGADLFLPISTPSGMTVNPNNHKVYVIDSNGNVAVVDGVAQQVLTSFDTGVGASPDEIIANPASNKVFVFGRSGGVIIDSTSDTPGATIPITNAYGVAVDAANNRIYVAGVDANDTTQAYQLFALDGSSGAVLKSVKVDSAGAVAVDSSASTVYLATNQFVSGTQGITAFSTSTLAVSKTFSGLTATDLAFDSTNGGRLYLGGASFAGDSANSYNNSVVVLNPADSSTSFVTVGYVPNAVATNPNTGRTYVLDEKTPELLIFDNASHSVLSRVPVKSDLGFQTPPEFAISVAKDRVYIPYVTLSGVNDYTAYLDVRDGSGALVQTIQLNVDQSNHFAAVAVDDVHHRVYVTGERFNSGTGTEGLVFAIDTDTNTVVGTISLPSYGAYIAVNPVTGRVYVNGVYTGTSYGVSVIDGSNNTFVKNIEFIDAGRMAVNTKTNKIYVAHYAQGDSSKNTVQVIDGATDTFETSFNNINNGPGNTDNVFALAVDEVNNRLFISDDSNGFQAIGRVTVFNLANNGYQGQTELGYWPAGIAYDSVTQQVFVANNNDGNVSVVKVGQKPGPPAPPHGGLSATVFTINGNSTPANDVADTVLHFAAQQSGTPAGLKVRVQVNTVADNNLNDWADLNNGSNGYMTVDKATGQFVLSSTNYPLANGIYFRALSTAPGYPDSKSNIIGPFNLAASQNHLGTTVLFMATNGGGQEMKFRSKVGVDQAGIAVRIQSTSIPDDEASWADLNDGNSGGMHPFADPKQFYLDTTKYPTGDAVYFRAITTAPGFMKSISNIIGVTNVANGTPPEVSVFPSTLDQLQPGSGGGLSANDPFVLALGSMKFTVQASSPENKALTAIALMYDGSTINKSEASAVDGTLNTDYLTNVPGDHVLKAYAKDERGVIGYADPVYIRVLPPGGRVFTMVSSGDWSDSKNWQDATGQNGVPGANDLAVVGAQNATISQNITAFAVSLFGGSVSGSGGALTVSGMFSIAAGQLRNINLTIDSHGTLAINSPTDVPVSGSVNNLGTIRILNTGGIIPVLTTSGVAMPHRGDSANGFLDGVAAFFKNLGDVIFHHPSVKPKPQTPPANPPNIRAPRGITAASFVNQGRLITNDGSSLVTDNGSGLISEGGSTIIGNDGASLITNDGSSIIGNDGASLITNDGSSLITNDGSSLVTNDGASLRVRPNPSSTSAFKAATAASAFTQSGGQIDLRHLVVMGPLNVDGGSVLGSGVIYGDLTNNGGYISPGHSAGTISVVGNFTQGPGGTYIVEHGGAIGSQSDLLEVTGSASLSGKIDIRAINGYKPDPSDTFSPLSYSSVTGSFSSVSANASIAMNSNGMLANDNISIPQPRSGQPINISTRMQVLSDDNVLIAGFIVTGPGGSSKKVLIRGVGPSLANFGVPGTLVDPLLELHKPDGTTVMNDNWQEGDTSQVPSGFAPSDPRESVIVASLAPGNYTAVVRGAHGETGVGLAEVYDLDANSTAQLANISTRGFVNTNDNVMIGGFIVGGSEPARILVRAIGPTLTDFGVQGALADPTLELHDANGATISNDDWRETQEAEIIATTIPPNKNQEPAILATLVPGNYTAVVRGKNNTTGIGLVEAYNLQ